MEDIFSKKDNGNVSSIVLPSPFPQPPNSLTAQQPNSPTTQQPNSPTAQPPNSLTAQQPNSLTAQQPNTLTAQPPNSLTAQPPNHPTTQPPNSPTAQQPNSPTTLQITYHTYGRLNPDRSNVVWVSHALTANSDVFSWWPGLFGPEDLFNPEEYFIVCPNILGSHYGTSGPLHVNPATGELYLYDFPQFTVRDMVQVHKLLADHLGIGRIHVLIGGSLGGQQALEWNLMEPDRVDNLVLLSTNAVHSPWGIAFNESQRMAIELDPSWGLRRPDAGMEGMKTARSIALLSYRHYDTYKASQGEEDAEKADHFRAASYQRYQGEKLYRRFNAFSYWYLSKAMDSHNVGRGRGGVEAALSGIKARTLVIGINRDILFPPEEQIRIAKAIPNAEYAEIDSHAGHDGFLIETEKISRVVGGWLERNTNTNMNTNTHANANTNTNAHANANTNTHTNSNTNTNTQGLHPVLVMSPLRGFTD